MSHFPSQDCLKHYSSQVCTVFFAQLGPIYPRLKQTARLTLLCLKGLQKILKTCNMYGNDNQGHLRLDSSLWSYISLLKRKTFPK